MKHIASYVGTCGRRATVTWTDEHDYRVERTGMGIEPEETRFDVPLSATHAWKEDKKNQAMDHAKAWTDGKPSNVEFVCFIMQYAETGPMMQAFIINALVEAADKYKDTPIKAGGFIHPAAWQATAKELHEVMNKRLTNQA